MTTDVAASPRLRVGLIGCGHVGLHLIERSAVGGPFQVVAACDDSDVADLVSPFGVRWMNLQELARSEEIDVLWVTSFWKFPFGSSTSEIAPRHHMIAEAPLTLDAQVAEQAFAAAALRGRQLLVHYPRRADEDFQQALAVARDEKIGAIRAAKFVHWSYGRPPHGDARNIKPAYRDEYAETGVTLVRFVAHAVDQLLLLVPSRPVSVIATADQSLHKPGLFGAESVVLQVEFESGCQADIDIRLDSPTPFQSGWVLTGEQGGFASGRQYTLTDEGEVFDSPVIPNDVGEENDPLAWLAQRIRSGMQDVVEETRNCAVVSILDGVQRSLVRRGSVTL